MTSKATKRIVKYWNDNVGHFRGRLGFTRATPTGLRRLARREHYCAGEVNLSPKYDGGTSHVIIFPIL